LLVTSNLQFAGMEASTCVFITKKLVEETGVRSGLLRATTRLVVVSYSEDIHPEEVTKRFLVKDKTGIIEKWIRKEVDSAAKKGDIACVKQLQLLETSGTPLLLELRSTSGAGEYQGDKLGLYHLTIDPREERLKQGLVYRQLHDVRANQCQYYLFRVGDYWWVNDEVGEEERYLRAKVGEANELLPPISGWEFWDEDDCSDDNVDDDWHSDLTIECSREVSPAILENWEKNEEKRKEKEERIRKEQALAAEVDTAAKKGEIARVKQLQQLETDGIPLLLELRSTSGAGEWQGDCLGLYHLTIDPREEILKQGLVYRQLHGGNNQREQFYLHRVGEYWWVNKEVGKKTGNLKAKMGESDHLLPPVQGWEFYHYDGGVKWESDPTMVCSRQVNPLCCEVIVELDSDAMEKHPHCAGSYLPVDGEYNRGRPVMQHSSGSNRYLTVPTGYTSWGISSTIDGSRGWIGSGSAGGLCPADPASAVNSRLGLTSWRYWDGNRLIESKDIRVRCVTHP